MKIDELMQIIEKHVPLKTAESWDNVGLLIGDKHTKMTGILTALDCTNEVVEEALTKEINTIICHHPLIFKGLTSITDDGYGQLIRKIIQHDIQVIALHTNLDHYYKGVNAMLATKLKLQDTEILVPQTTTYYKVQTFIPEEHLEQFKRQISKAGLAQEGNYEYCFFESKGTGQFKPVGEANPFIGKIDHIEYVNEVKLEFMIQSQQRKLAEHLIQQYHPYETPVYDFIELSKEADSGLGMIGNLATPQNVKDFIQETKSTLAIPSLRYAGKPDITISRVAIIGGSGIGFEHVAFQRGADIFVTGDVRHHDALDAKTEGMNILDINHYSEYVMKDGLKQLLSDWLTDHEADITIASSSINTDPFQYY